MGLGPGLAHEIVIKRTGTAAPRDGIRVRLRLSHPSDHRLGNPVGLTSAGCPTAPVHPTRRWNALESLLAPTVQDHLNTANGRGVRSRPMQRR
jgi:hypothetical protein